MKYFKTFPLMLSVTSTAALNVNEKQDKPNSSPTDAPCPDDAKVLDAMDCVADYARDGKCDWENWTEMYINCDLPGARIDDYLLPIVEANECTWERWTDGVYLPLFGDYLKDCSDDGGGNNNGGPTPGPTPTPGPLECIDTRASGSGPAGDDSRGSYIDGTSSQCEYYRDKSECHLFGKGGCEKTCGICSPTDINTVRQYVLETGYPLAKDWEFEFNSDGPQIEGKDDFLTYSVEDQSGYNVWVKMHAKDEFSTSNGGCVLRFSVRCNEVRDASEIKFTLSGGVILRWNGSSFSYQSWSNGFTTLGSSDISPNSQWHTIVMVITGDKVSLFEDGLERFRDKSTRVGKTIKPVFHMQALNRGSNLSFDLKDIFVMPGVSYVQGNSSWDYPMLGDMLPSSVLTYKERDGGGKFSFDNYGFTRFSSFPQIKHNMWGNLQVERKVPNGVFTYWVRVNSSGGSESKVQLPGNVILRLVNNGNSASWVTWTGGRFSPIGPSNIQAGQNEFTVVTLVFSANTVTVMEEGRIVGTLESMNRGDVSPSIGLQHLQSGTDVSIDIGGFRTVPSTKLAQHTGPDDIVIVTPALNQCEILRLELIVGCTALLSASFFGAIAYAGCMAVSATAWHICFENLDRRLSDADDDIRSSKHLCGDECMKMLHSVDAPEANAYDLSSGISDEEAKKSFDEGMAFGHDLVAKLGEQEYFLSVDLSMFN